MGASICWVAAEIDTQSTIFDLSALKEQLLIFLYSSINQFMWQEVAVILTAVFGVVVISEFISATVRGRIS